jgi:tetratricopeptide (TPR) repeat protein
MRRRSETLLAFALWLIGFASGQTLPDTSRELNNTYTDATQALRRQEFQTAANLARRMISLCPRCRMGHAILAAALMELNQLADAQLAAEEEVKINPADPIAYKTLGNVYAREHELEKAAVQFQKAAEINPRDYDVHVALGKLLREQKKYKEALAELAKGLAISPDNPSALLVQGECEVDLGNTSKGIAEMQQAVSASTSPEPWNSAAYELADHDLDLEQAQKWSETSIDLTVALLRNVSVEHLGPAQLRVIPSIGSYWDTFGWILYKRANYAAAREYLEAAWSLRPIPVIGNHLGRTYEKLDRREDAARTYAMAIAAADLPSRSARSANLLDEIRGRLAKVAAPDANIEYLVRAGRVDLKRMNSVDVPNSAHAGGSTELALKIEGDKITDFRTISGSTSVTYAAEGILGLKLPLKMPQGPLPRRGVISCQAEQSQCRLRMLSAEDAMNAAIEDDVKTAPSK